MFYKVKLQLSKDQAKRLAKGYSTQIPYNGLDKGSEIYVQKRLFNKIKKAKLLRKGVRLALLPKELRQNVKKGSGFFDDIWSGIKSIGEKVLPKVVDKGVDALLNKALSGKGAKRRSHRVKRGKGWRDVLGKIGQIARPVGEKIWTVAKPRLEKEGERLAEKGLEALIKKISGSGKRKVKRGRSIRRPGASLFPPGRSGRFGMYPDFIRDL